MGLCGEDAGVFSEEGRGISSRCFESVLMIFYGFFMIWGVGR